MKAILLSLMLFVTQGASAASLFVDLGLAAHRNWEGPHSAEAMPYDANKIANPYAYVSGGVISRGYQWGDSVTFTHRFELSHESSIATGRDRGLDSARWVMRFEFK